MAPRPTNVARWVALALIVVAASPLRAQEPELPPDIVEAPFALYVNHVDKDDLLVLLQGDEVYVDRNDLLRAGIKPLGGEDAIIGGRTLLRLSSVSPPITYRVDEQEVALRVELPPEWLGNTEINMAGRPQEIEYRTDTSAFFNYAPRLSDSGQLLLYQESGLSVGGHLLFNSMNMSTTREPTRGLSYFAIDDRHELRRYTLGDVVLDAGPLGGGGVIGGLTLQRTYELDPYIVTRPGIGMRGTTAAPATLDVLVNGAVVYQQELQPGTFQLRNILPGVGAGAAGYVIRDIFGNEQVLEAPFYVASDALAVGTEEYTYSFGFLRRDLGSESWGYGRPVGIASHRTGFHEMLTLGARAEIGGDRFSGGPTAAFVLPFGQFELGLAGSRHTSAGFGGAAQLGYGFTTAFFGARFFSGVMSDHYVHTGIDPEGDRATAEGGASVSIPIAFVNVSYTGRVAARRDTGVVTDSSISASMPVGLGIQWRTFFSRSTQAGMPLQWEVQSSLSWSPIQRHQLRVAGRTGSQGESMQASVNRVANDSYDVGARAAVQYETALRAEGRIQYQAPVGRYAANYQYQPTGSALLLEAAGGLVVVPGAGVFATLPVQGAFGVIRTGGVSGVSAFGNNKEIDVSDRHGLVLVPELLPYYANQLRIDPNDLPLEYSVDVTEMSLAPPQRGVAIADFPVRRSHYYRGAISVDTGGDRTIPSFGQVTVRQPGEDILSPLGEAGEFELDGVQPGVHTAVIEWVDGPCAMTIDFPETDDAWIALGELVCSRPRPEGAEAP